MLVGARTTSRLVITKSPSTTIGPGGARRSSGSRPSRSRAATSRGPRPGADERHVDVVTGLAHHSRRRRSRAVRAPAKSARRAHALFFVVIVTSPQTNIQPVRSASRNSRPTSIPVLIICRLEQLRNELERLGASVSAHTPETGGDPTGPSRRHPPSRVEAHAAAPA
jgi:hypothetical protein